uniref:Uncharacterized protein n=1 Tax=Arundo donax TaxID=35708 RepID=A0A0A9GK49_ARUDO
MTTMLSSRNFYPQRYVTYCLKMLLSH